MTWLLEPVTTTYAAVIAFGFAVLALVALCGWTYLQWLDERALRKLGQEALSLFRADLDQEQQRAAKLEQRIDELLAAIGPYH